jgi:RNA-binding protein YlmH
MAKSKAVAMPMMDPDHDEYQTRDDVQQMMRMDEIHSNPKRLSRAVKRLHSTAARYSKKSAGRRSGR